MPWLKEGGDEEPEALRPDVAPRLARAEAKRHREHAPEKGAKDGGAASSEVQEGDDEKEEGMGEEEVEEEEEEEEEDAKYSKDDGEDSEDNEEDGDDECKAMLVAAEEHALRSEYEFGFNTELLMPWRLRHGGTPGDAELGLAPKMEALAALPPKNLFD